MRTGPSTVLPLFFTTGVGLLATDIYLPSIPVLPNVLGGTVADAQFTLAIFFVTFATCQLLYGALAECYGNFRIVLTASAIFVASTIFAALSQTIELLTVARALQGVGAAAATAIVPAMIRSNYDERTSIRMLSWLGICESVIPALAPLLGALILHLAGWRTNFWLLAAVGIVALLMLLRNRAIYVGARTGGSHQVSSLRSLIPSYAAVLSNRSFLGYALGYSTAYGALLTFVGAAPFLLQSVYGQAPASFGFMQIVMVLVFISGSLLAGRSVDAVGTDKTILFGLLMLVASATVLPIVALGLIPNSAISMTLAILPSQFGLGLRFGVAMSAAIGSVPHHQPSAAAMTSFLCFVFAAIGNLAFAMLIDFNLLGVAVCCVGFSLVSAMAYLITPSPANSGSANPT
jgi:DHA1 family bicyclomycin/chloramphenicol resistance-like MFS transporter